MEKKTYQWDFDGAWMPGRQQLSGGQHTFSLGIFQWIPKASGKGLKRGPVAKRIKGLVSNPQEAIGRARAEVDRLNFELQVFGGNER